MTTTSIHRADSLTNTAGTLLINVAYADAAGLPVEGQPALNRMSALQPGVDVFFGSEAAGSWSDDTQLTIAVAAGLAAARGFDIHVIADEHANQLDATPKIVIDGAVAVVRGWGESTYESVVRYTQGVDPSESGAIGGAGNGVLMKLAPLVVWQVAAQQSTAQRHAQLDVLTALTHRSVAAQVCSRVHGDVLHHLLTNPSAAGSDVLSVALRSAHQHEEELAVPGVLSQHLKGLAQLQRVPVHQREAALRALVCVPSPSGRWYGFYAPETLAVAYGSWVVWRDDRRLLEDLVYDTISLGGDTDTTAAIVAAMMTLHTGGQSPVPHDAHLLADLDGILAASMQFADYIHEVASAS